MNTIILVNVMNAESAPPSDFHGWMEGWMEGHVVPGSSRLH